MAILFEGDQSSATQPLAASISPLSKATLIGQEPFINQHAQQRWIDPQKQAPRQNTLREAPAFYINLPP